MKDLRDTLLGCRHPKVHDHGLGETMWCPDCGAIAPHTSPSFKGDRWRNPSYSVEEETPPKDFDSMKELLMEKPKFCHVCRTWISDPQEDCPLGAEVPGAGTEPHCFAMTKETP